MVTRVGEPGERDRRPEILPRQGGGLVKDGATGAGTAASIVDIGGGASRLADALLDEGYRSVTVLDLSSTQVTDASAKHLAEMKNLTTLSLYQSGMSSKGIDAVRKALPKCRIRD